MAQEKVGSLLEEVTQFVYREARLADEHQYEAWESLWTDDGIYWVPADNDGGDPNLVMSIIYDNRSRIALRVKQLLTGRRYSQEPRSRIRRIVSNVEILDQDERGIRIGANSILYEARDGAENIFPSRNEYILRRENDGFRLAYKKVSLVNAEEGQFAMAFII
ncbi:aromatic-ring-hydroxylating dioxygenase subunit beta [Azospirillum sp. INR13]|uniref:aromatic-ring-hydroxylating dioxygenase subunit beta n=1 Tax=Azospirillum sp. INR13 TaxID=2596919 RepID=UPI001892622A|nr:aromatic-ring-hydroxylating dioxygenase subunit beta [Azospirillum sp. INR13]MBF5096516.1 aromatic-ring-hydroxylating dioxygenase subunit beta [Azospirillum sp. INR13]